MSFMKEQRVYKLIFVNQKKKKKGKEKKTIYYKKIIYIHTIYSYEQRNTDILSRQKLYYFNKKLHFI